MKLAIIFFMTIFCAMSVSAETLTFSGWLKNGESATTEKQSFLVQINSFTNKIWADYGTGAMQIENNSCDQTQTAKVCVDNIEYLLPDRRYRAQVRIYSLAPKITIERSFANTELIIGNDTVVTVTIENEGDVAAELTYTDSLSEDIQVEDINGAFTDNGKVVWEGVLKAGEDREITYRIRPMEEMDRKFAATVRYFDGFEMKTASSTEISLKVTPFMKMVTKINGRTDIFIGEIFNYSVNITNLDTKAVNIDFLEIRIDKGLEAVEKPSDLTMIDETTFRYEQWQLTQNRSKIFKFKIKGKLTSESNVYAKAAYKGNDGVARTLDETKNSVKITDKGISLKTNLNEKIIEEGEEKKLTISISNNNPAGKLKNVFVSTSSNMLYIPNGYFDTIAESKTERIEKTFIVPSVTAQRGFIINLNVTYTTEFGDNGSKIVTETVHVVPVKDLVVTQTIDKTTIESGEQAIVKIKIENPRLVKVNGVYIKSSVPEEFIISGATTNRASIYSKETIDGVTFYITAPKVKETKLYNVSTTVTYSDGKKNYSYEKKQELTIKPKDLKLTITKSVTEASIYEGEPFSVTYAIRNPSEEDTAKNITLQFPLQNEFDLVDSQQEYTIPYIGPGELIYVYNKERLRAKYNTSITLLKTTVHYENEEGTKFSANSSETSITANTAYKKGPVILLEKKTEETANNVDGFNVTLIAKNKGDEQTTVLVKDATHEWMVLLDPDAQKSFTYKGKIASPGTHDLQIATAHYTQGNRTYITASNIPTIMIEEKPLIILQRSVPSEGNTIDSLPITLTVQNLLGKEISNLTIYDRNNEWILNELTDKKEITHTIDFTSPGSYAIEKARATYIFDEQLYHIESDQATVEISEKKALTLEKTNEQTGNTATIKITALNLLSEEIQALIQDNGKEWQISIPGNGGQTVSYTTELSESALLAPATARFSINGRNITEQSNSVTVRLEKQAEDKPTQELEKKEEGIMDKILGVFKAILTWKRKG